MEEDEIFSKEFINEDKTKRMKRFMSSETARQYRKNMREIKDSIFNQVNKRETRLVSKAKMRKYDIDYDDQ